MVLLLFVQMPLECIVALDHISQRGNAPIVIEPALHPRKESVQRCRPVPHIRRTAGVKVVNTDFIASTDQNNELKTIAKPKASPLSYVESVAWSLWDGFSDYGFVHADPWHVGAAANPNEEMAFDKAGYEKATEVKMQAAHVAAAAVALAIEY